MYLILALIAVPLFPVAWFILQTIIEVLAMPLTEQPEQRYSSRL